jgi:UV DNA damage endonuclease
VHFSSARLDGRAFKRGKEVRVEPPLLRQHADYIDPWTCADFLGALHDRAFDVMLEAKAKDLALLKLRQDLGTLGFEWVLAWGPPEAGGEERHAVALEGEAQD